MSADSASSFQHLQQVRDWAQAKIDSRTEPPWAWYQYMKLLETIDSILAGMSVTTTESSLQSDQRPGTHLRLVDPSDPQGSVPHRPAGEPVQLPM